MNASCREKTQIAVVRSLTVSAVRDDSLEAGSQRGDFFSREARVSREGTVAWTGWRAHGTASYEAHFQRSDLLGIIYPEALPQARNEGAPSALNTYNHNAKTSGQEIGAILTRAAFRFAFSPGGDLCVMA
jgi:hypothetical protein